MKLRLAMKRCPLWVAVLLLAVAAGLLIEAFSAFGYWAAIIIATLLILRLIDHQGPTPRT